MSFTNVFPDRYAFSQWYEHYHEEPEEIKEELDDLFEKATKRGAELGAQMAVVYDCNDPLSVYWALERQLELNAPLEDTMNQARLADKTLPLEEQHGVGLFTQHCPLVHQTWRRCGTRIQRCGIMTASKQLIISFFGKN